MKRQIYMKGCALFLAAALMFSSHLNAYAVTEEDKQAQEDKIEDLENEKEQANTELDTLQTDKANTEMEIEALDSQLTDIQTQIAQTETDLAQAEEDLEQTKKDLEEAREKEESQYETLKIRINVMYRKGETGYLEILLGADDIASLLNSTEYISRISDYDSNLLQSLQETREQIEELEAQQVRACVEPAAGDYRGIVLVLVPACRVCIEVLPVVCGHVAVIEESPAFADPSFIIKRAQLDEMSLAFSIRDLIRVEAGLIAVPCLREFTDSLGCILARALE